MPHIATPDGTRLYYEEVGRGHAGGLRPRICRRLPHLGAAAALFRPLASLHHLEPARLSAVGRARRSRALQPGHRPRRHHRGDGCA